MADPSHNRSDLARRIMEHEAARSPDPGGPADVLELACGRLKAHLVDLLGTGGVSALLRRALHLAKREHTLLAGVTVREEPGGCFTGLMESLPDGSEEESAAAAISVLTHLFDILVMLMGEELGMKPIRNIWPKATRDGEIEE